MGFAQDTCNLVPQSHSSKKVRFSVIVREQSSAYKINALFVWCNVTIFGHWIRSALIFSFNFLVSIDMSRMNGKALFLIRLRLVTTFYTYPEQTPDGPIYAELEVLSGPVKSVTGSPCGLGVLAKPAKLEAD